MRQDQFEPALQHGAALARRQPPPGAEGALGRGDGALGVRRAQRRHAPQQLLRGRIQHLDAAGLRDPLSVDIGGLAQQLTAPERETLLLGCLQAIIRTL